MYALLVDFASFLSDFGCLFPGWFWFRVCFVVNVVGFAQCPVLDVVDWLASGCFCMVAS